MWDRLLVYGAVGYFFFCILFPPVLRWPLSLLLTTITFCELVSYFLVRQVRTPARPTVRSSLGVVVVVGCFCKRTGGCRFSVCFRVCVEAPRRTNACMPCCVSSAPTSLPAPKPTHTGCLSPRAVSPLCAQRARSPARGAPIPRSERKEREREREGEGKRVL